MTKISDTFFPAINQLQRERTEHGTGLPVNIRTSLEDIAKSSNNRRVLFARENLLPNLENCHLDLTNHCSLIDRKIREQVSQKEIQKYNQEVQIFRDTVFATIIQLEECGYELSDNDPLVRLYRHCEEHVTEVMKDDNQFIPFLNSTLNINDVFTSVNTEQSNKSFARNLAKFSLMDEASDYTTADLFQDFEFTRQLIVDANNMVRSYELDRQETLSMDNPLKRLASFSHASNKQLAKWLATGKASDHPVYATMNGNYYSHSKGVVNHEEELQKAEEGSVADSSVPRDPLHYAPHRTPVFPGQDLDEDFFDDDEDDMPRTAHPHYTHHHVPRTSSHAEIREIEDAEIPSFLEGSQRDSGVRTHRSRPVDSMGRASEMPFSRSADRRSPHPYLVSQPNLDHMDKMRLHGSYTDEEPNVDFSGLFSQRAFHSSGRKGVGLSARRCSLDAMDMGMGSLSSQTSLKRPVPTHSSRTSAVV